MLSEQQTYQLVNGLLLLGFLIIGLWAVWGEAQPQCVYQARGLNCLGCGATRALGFLMLGQIKTAQAYGSLSISLAIFFPLFAISRIGFLFATIRYSWQRLLPWDITLSLGVFLTTFGPIIWQQISSGPLQ